MEEEKKINEAARELSKLGASRGGIARAKKLTPEERSEIARHAVQTRWKKSGVTDNILRSEHFNDLSIGGSVFKAAVLEDGRRVLTRATFVRAIGRKGKAKGGRAYDDEFKLPVFLTAKNLNPFIPDDLQENSSPIIFKHKSNQFIGYRAELLPQVCGVFIDADEAGVLTSTQKHIAEKCRILIRGLATVGIIALVDEATGYQEIRDKQALQQILELYIAKELRPWLKTFPDEFYENLFRLRGWQFRPLSVKRPALVGKLTNDLIYKRLAPGLLDELKQITPRDDKGRTKHRYFQRLTDNIGHPKLREHLASVTTLMKASTTWDKFYRLIERALPRYGRTMEIPFNDLE